MPGIPQKRIRALASLLTWLAVVAGCQIAPGTRRLPPPEPAIAPRELEKAILPAYRVEPPDVLLINAVRLPTGEQYTLRSGDVVYVQGPPIISTEPPIQGEYPIGPGGLLNLGPTYEWVNVDGMTVADASRAVEAHLERKFPNVEGQPGVRADYSASVALAIPAGIQQVQGQHLVGPDGAVTLGAYGSVLVVGMTLPEAKQAIEAHLSKDFERPEVSVDVLGYNSHVYYIVTQGAGLGDTVVRVPVTGNETVLDAIANVNGIPQVASKKMWIARPGKNQCGQDQILPIDYEAITARGENLTNYQLMRGDRLFIAENKLVATDTALAKLIAPFERVMGFSLLGVGTVTRFSGNVLQGGGARNSLGGGGGGAF
ncbi:MAG: polysaccharide biosynthesis/export family protein [Planctomycetes bacterium]|nr:polysaccharide biosynthesis/export family protein [Planctomycetota bacterium]